MFLFLENVDKNKEKNYNNLVPRASSRSTFKSERKGEKDLSDLNVEREEDLGNGWKYKTLGTSTA